MVNIDRWDKNEPWRWCPEKGEAKSYDGDYRRYRVAGAAGESLG